MPFFPFLRSLSISWSYRYKEYTTTTIPLQANVFDRFLPLLPPPKLSKIPLGPWAMFLGKSSPTTEKGRGLCKH